MDRLMFSREIETLGMIHFQRLTNGEATLVVSIIIVVGLGVAYMIDKNSYWQ